MTVKKKQPITQFFPDDQLTPEAINLPQFLFFSFVYIIFFVLCWLTKAENTKMSGNLPIIEPQFHMNRANSLQTVVIQKKCAQLTPVSPTGYRWMFFSLMLSWPMPIYYYWLTFQVSRTKFQTFIQDNATTKSPATSRALGILRNLQKVYQHLVILKVIHNNASH